MVEEAINRLDEILNKVPQLLEAIGVEEMSGKPLPHKWSKKEILGHLIDSATNNHQRFVRGQFELNPEIGYDQDRWNKFSFYQDMDHLQIIEFWTAYNKHLLALISRIPKENLTRNVKVGENLFTLDFLIVDYLDHLEHHLKQLIDY